MPIRIEYSDDKGKSIDLNADGSIALYGTHGERVDVLPAQAAMLKAMILAEAELMRQAQR